MTKTYKKILQQLPMDEHLKSFLLNCGFAVPKELPFTGGRSPANTKALVSAISDCDDSLVSEKIVSQLARLESYNFRYAQQAFFDALGGDDDAKNTIAELTNQLHRALWITLYKPQCLKKAKSLIDFDRYQKVSSRVLFPSKKTVINIPAARQAFGEELQKCYQESLACGSSFKVDVTPRDCHVFHFYMYIQGLSETIEEFKDGESLQTDICPPVSASLQYSELTGIAEIQVKGKRYRDAIIRAFAKYFLEEEVEPEKLLTPDLNLEVFLKREITLPSMFRYGIEEIQVKRLTFQTDSGLKIAMENCTRGDRDCVYDMVCFDLEDQIDVMRDWELKRAELKLYFTENQQLFPGESSLKLTLTDTGKIGGWDNLQEKQKNYPTST